MVFLTLAVMYLVYRQLDGTGALEMIGIGDRLRQELIAFGYLGAIIIIGLMATAVVINPIPSAPIALAPGAAFGHTWGTIYVVVGAGIGAVAAFSIARALGYQVLEGFLGRRFKRYEASNQNRLMIIVFASRLIPFVSFDLVSYAAGLTPLSYGRFAIAAFVGLIPTSFLLTHFGSEQAVTELNQAFVALVMLGVVALIPLLFESHPRASKQVQTWVSSEPGSPSLLKMKETHHVENREFETENECPVEHRPYCVDINGEHINPCRRFDNSGPVDHQGRGAF